MPCFASEVTLSHSNPSRPVFYLPFLNISHSRSLSLSLSLSHCRSLSLSLSLFPSLSSCFPVFISPYLSHVGISKILERATNSNPNTLKSSVLIIRNPQKRSLVFGNPQHSAVNTRSPTPLTPLSSPCHFEARCFRGEDTPGFSFSTPFQATRAASAPTWCTMEMRTGVYSVAMKL